MSAKLHFLHETKMRDKKVAVGVVSYAVKRDESPPRAKSFHHLACDSIILQQLNTLENNKVKCFIAGVIS